MGDIHVHTAPHEYEPSGYAVWYWGDTAFSLVYAGLACCEIAVARYMHQKKQQLPWKDCGGGGDWWSRKFLFIVSLVPLTLIRAANLYVWGEFNGQAGVAITQPDADLRGINWLKDEGDWLNAITYWYLLAIKSLFLLAWIDVNRLSGNVRWKNIYVHLAMLMLVLILALGVPQGLVVHYGRICQMQRQNDYCRKYHDMTSTLAVTQALVGLLFCGVFGAYTWSWKSADMAGYEALSPQVALLEGGSRDSYGTTHTQDGEGGTKDARDSDPRYRLNDARRYSGVAYCFFFSLVAHTAFNVYFAWYASGGLGLMGNGAMMVLTILKLIAVEVAPLAWTTVTVYADVTDVESVADGSCSMENFAGDLPGRKATAIDSEDDDDDKAPSANAFQIE
mmetsp:Transcript_40241/g.95544  ORF Transcript_40241/g.95544 Transcript_40241/m.95544 type:complete len:392 (+) Transcript_40241:238-1413(+)